MKKISGSVMWVHLKLGVAKQSSCDHFTTATPLLSFRNNREIKRRVIVEGPERKHFHIWLKGPLCAAPNPARFGGFSPHYLNEELS